MKKIVVKIFTIWFSLKEWIRFLLVGGYNTLFSYILFVLLFFFLESWLHYKTILLITYLIVIVNNWVTLRIFVFKKQKAWFKELLKTFGVYLIVYYINVLLLEFLSFFIREIIISQAICNITLPFITYFLFKVTVYRKTDLNKRSIF